MIRSIMAIRLIVTIFLLVFITNLKSQVIEAVITNPFSENERLGFDLELSNSGSTIAIASIASPSIYTSDGRVQIYKRNSNSWSKFGEDITTDIDSSFFATTIALSGNGSLLAIGAESYDTDRQAIGAVYIFELTSDEIIPLDTLYGEFSFERFGTSIDFNHTGDKIIIGTRRTSAFIYERQGDAYSLLHEVESEFFSAEFGRLVDIDAEGDRFAVMGSSFHGGIPKNDVHVFQSTQDSFFVIPSPIISSDDNRIEELNLNESGDLLSLRIHQDYNTFHNYSITDTLVYRNDMVDEEPTFYDRLRFADDGNFIAVNYTSGIRFFEYQNNLWRRLPNVLLEEGSLIDLAISENRKFVAKSVWGATNAGDQVSIYGLDFNVSTADLDVEPRVLFPNPATDYLHVKPIEEGTTTYIIVDQVGRTVQQGELRNNKLELTTLKNGVYFLSLNGQNSNTNFEYKFFIQR